jgi:UDP-N-acetylmuramoylalanine--D-glutamate ligase
MTGNFLENLYDKKILILGFGLEGLSTLKFLLKHSPSSKITVADKNESLSENIVIKDNHLSFIGGADYLRKINKFDIVFKTPGISLKDIEIKDKTKICSQSQLFISLFKNQIIGITGTKGKSTTSSLIYHIISKYTQNVILVGNIGIPPLDLYDQINEKSIIVYEISSHQLEFNTVSPHIAILLNTFEEHLDHYNSYLEYKLAKFNIAKYQNKDDYFIYNADDEVLMKILELIKPTAKLYPYSEKLTIQTGCMLKKDYISFIDCHDEKLRYNLNEKRKLPGHHNLFNIMPAICACKIIGISDDFISKGISTFKPLEHRIEYVGKYNNVVFYNDSIATIPEATIEAVKTLKNIGTIILGGFDRDVHYENLMNFILTTSIKNIIFLGNAGKRMHDIIKEKTTNNNKSLFVVKSFEEAVYTAIKKTPRDMICLLSPAAASYDMFKNFEERGRKFKQLVKEL